MDTLLFWLFIILATLSPVKADHAGPNILNVARYAEPYDSPIDKFAVFEDAAFLSATQDTVDLDLVKFMHIERKPSYTMKELADINRKVNATFPYRLDKFNLWRVQMPVETILWGSGDCKSLANFKYHLLRQMGYKNVKIITVMLPDGEGDFAGHAILLLNDIWILDINYPYLYEFAYLRSGNQLYKAYDDKQVYLIRHGF